MNYEVEFDEKGLLARISQATASILRRTGAYIRRVAQRKVQTSPNPSTPGSPPHSRRGALKRGLLFGVESKTGSVLIGPSYNFVGTSMVAHEFGGGYMKERNPKRPQMGPALRETVPHIAKFWQDTVK